MAPFFSIILPIYNVELFVKEAFLSLIPQGIPFEEYEVILVDDGSQDRSVAIVNELLHKLPNAYWIHQENKGLSEARNAGLEKARGEYVWFVDSDDFIAPNSLALLKKKLLEEKCPDMLALSGVEFGENGRSQISVQYAENQISRSGVEHLADTSLFIAVHHYLFRRSFLVQYQISFYPRIMHEDEEFLPRALYKAFKISYSSFPVYHYRKRTGSITMVYNPQRCRDLLTVAESLFSFYEQSPHSALLTRVDHVVKAPFGLYRRYNDKRGAMEFFTTFLQNATLRSYLRVTSNRKIKLLFNLARVMPYSFVWKLFLLQQKSMRRG